MMDANLAGSVPFPNLNGTTLSFQKGPPEMERVPVPTTPRGTVPNDKNCPNWPGGVS